MSLTTGAFYVISSGVSCHCGVSVACFCEVSYSEPRPAAFSELVLVTALCLVSEGKSWKLALRHLVGVTRS